jgi:hypothetical protein
MRATAATSWIAASTAAAAPTARPARVDQEQRDEADDRALAHDEQARAEPEPPDPRVAHRRRRVDHGPGRGGRRRVAHEQRGRHRGDGGERGEGEERGLERRGERDRRQGERGDRAAERDRGLAHAEREAALAPAEPAHDGAAARARGAGGERADEEERRGEQPERPRARGEDEDRGRGGEPAAEHRALAEPVGEGAERDEREGHADGQRGEQQADLGERQGELVADDRGQAAEALPQRADDHRPEHPDGEDDPAVAGRAGHAGVRRSRSARCLAAFPQPCIEHQRRRPAGDRS